MGIELASNMIRMKDAIEYFDRLNLESGMDIETREILKSQLKQLEGMYGKVISKEDFLNIIEMQLKVTHTGYFTEPVGIVEFMESSKFMNQKRYVRPKIMEHLVKLWTEPERYDHVILGGGIGTGKNYFLDMSFAYLIYRLSCMYSPQAHFGLAPGSDIVILFQSRNFDAAKKIVFNQFKQRIEASEYFSENFMFNKRNSNELKFPNNIIVKPISSADTAALSMNVLFAAIDEINFLSVVKRKRGVQGPNQETYDQGQKLYETVRGRIESRYKTSTGTMGKIFLLSSANYKGDFIDRLEEESKTNSKIFVMHMSQWESNPEKYSKKVFYVKLPTETNSTVIQSEEPDSMKGWITVPIDLREDFEKTPEECLRSRAGVAIENQHRFMNMSDLNDAYDAYAGVYGSRTVNIFNRDNVVINYLGSLKELIDWKFIQYLKGEFAVHIDLGLNTDSGGIAVAHVIGGKATSSIVGGDKYLPVYGICGVIAINPPVNEMEDIDLIKIQDLILMLGKHLSISKISLDQFQSASTVQLFRKHGYKSELIGMDRSLEPYIALKTALRNGRVYMPYNKVLDSEFKYLHQDLVSGKVDHTNQSSKDVSDAVAGVLYSLSLMRGSYKGRGGEVKKIVPTNGDTFVVNDVEEKHTKRVTTGRKSWYRRHKNNT